MKVIKIIQERDIFPDAPAIDVENFDVREASRAVVFGKDGSVFLLKNNMYNYHKLPGGGIEEDEDAKTGLERELMEEIGCKAEVTNELGQVVEYRDQLKLKQISYCYVAKQIGEQQASSFDAGETEQGFEVVIVKDIDDAINTLENDKPQDYEGKFIVPRDLFLLKTAK